MVDILSWSTIVLGRHTLSIPRWPLAAGAISMLVFHQGEPGSIPGRVTGFSQVGIVPDDDVGRRVSSGISRLPHPPLQRRSIFTSITPSLSKVILAQAMNFSEATGQVCDLCRLKRSEAYHLTNWRASYRLAPQAAGRFSSATLLTAAKDRYTRIPAAAVLAAEAFPADQLQVSRRRARTTHSPCPRPYTVTSTGVPSKSAARHTLVTRLSSFPTRSRHARRVDLRAKPDTSGRARARRNTGCRLPSSHCLDPSGLCTAAVVMAVTNLVSARIRRGIKKKKTCPNTASRAVKQLRLFCLAFFTGTDVGDVPSFCSRKIIETHVTAGACPPSTYLRSCSCYDAALDIHDAQGQLQVSYESGEAEVVVFYLKLMRKAWLLPESVFRLWECSPQGNRAIIFTAVIILAALIADEKEFHRRVFEIDVFQRHYYTCVQCADLRKEHKLQMRAVECFQDATYCHRYTQCNENTASQFKALRLAAMAYLKCVAESTLWLPRFSFSNAEKQLKVGGNFKVAAWLKEFCTSEAQNRGSARGGRDIQVQCSIGSCFMYFNVKFHGWRAAAEARRAPPATVESQVCGTCSYRALWEFRSATTPMMSVLGGGNVSWGAGGVAECARIPRGFASRGHFRPRGSRTLGRVSINSRLRPTLTDVERLGEIAGTSPPPPPGRASPLPAFPLPAISSRPGQLRAAPISDGSPALAWRRRFLRPERDSRTRKPPVVRELSPTLALVLERTPRYELLVLIPAVLENTRGNKTRAEKAGMENEQETGVALMDKARQRTVENRVSGEQAKLRYQELMRVTFADRCKMQTKVAKLLDMERDLNPMSDMLSARPLCKVSSGVPTPASSRSNFLARLKVGGDVRGFPSPSSRKSQAELAMGGRPGLTVVPARQVRPDDLKMDEEGGGNGTTELRPSPWVKSPSPTAATLPLHLDRSERGGVHRWDTPLAARYLPPQRRPPLIIIVVVSRTNRTRRAFAVPPPLPPLTRAVPTAPRARVRASAALGSVRSGRELGPHPRPASSAHRARINPRRASLLLLFTRARGRQPCASSRHGLSSTRTWLPLPIDVAVAMEMGDESWEHHVSLMQMGCGQDHEQVNHDYLQQAEEVRRALARRKAEVAVFSRVVFLEASGIEVRQVRDGIQVVVCGVGRRDVHTAR
ncbi:hypothetical protein PR048_003221 [Dryococelus australis]|uniref:Uncharacterized protein n=1 Tax=Dryococelus australis TaxID=614101 RepID=A0ABQ9IMF8_9NEOP|nr:hypothetical protein PR048_003221 [Dryococelus australis]